MIVYRGTPKPEIFPAHRAYLCVFFTPSFDLAVDFASGPYAEWYAGYIQMYELPEQNLLDWNSLDARILSMAFLRDLGEEPSDTNRVQLFWEPPMEWIGFLERRGYTGMTGAGHQSEGGELCVFRPQGVKLMKRWRSIPGKRPQPVPIKEKAPKS